MFTQTLPSTQYQRGFTLLELMITVTIVSVLAAIAIPNYQYYMRKATYTEVVNQAAPYKVGVMSCYHVLGSFSGCNDGSNEIPTGISQGNGLVSTLSVQNGVITITPHAQKGIEDTDTYILTPQLPNANDNTVTWQTSGGGVDKGYAR